MTQRGRETGNIRSADKRRGDEAEHNWIRFGRRVASQDPESRVVVVARVGLGLLLPSRRSEKRVNGLPDLLPERDDLFGRVSHGALAVQSLADFAMDEQTDKYLSGVRQRCENV